MNVITINRYSTIMQNQTSFNPHTRRDYIALELANELNDTDNLAFYIKCTRKYPETILRKALSMALKMPAYKIKKSRGALFNYLVHKYAHESN